MDRKTREAIDKSIPYQEYKNQFVQFVQEGKTSGENQSEGYIAYTKLNLSRAERVEKKTKLSETTTESLSQINKPYYWLMITEYWCGDAAQINPVIEQIATKNPLIDLRVIFRDEHDVLMDDYETNGGRAIPIIVFIDKTTEEVTGFWGPRPSLAQEKVNEYKKKDPKPPYSELTKELQQWYIKNEQVDIQTEFIEAFQKATSTIIS